MSTLSWEPLRHFVPNSRFLTAIEPPKILMVDDRKENLLALTAVLKEEGYHLVEANSGREAIEQAVLHDFAAILLDVQMPEIDGFETAQLIRGVSRAKSTPIIFVTAIHLTEAHAAKGYNVGAIDYLFKPINPEVLKAKVSILADLYQKNLEIRLQNQRLQDQALYEKEKSGLEEAIQARDEFLSMASHELKTPITPLNLQMQYFIKMVKDKTLKKVDDDKLEDMLVTAYSQVERLSETIDKLLDVSRFTTGKVEMKLEVVNLTELVKKALESFEIQLNAVNCKYSLRAPDEVIGMWDAFRIEQVFINLLSNSMKYGAGKPIEIEIEQDSENAILRVRDFGIGIAEEDQTRIFNRFEKASSPQNYGGLGLGLYIACEIVRHHHGSIHVDSELGKGATFTVKLPLIKSSSKIQSAKT